MYTVYMYTTDYNWKGTYIHTYLYNVHLIARLTTGSMVTIESAYSILSSFTTCDEMFENHNYLVLCSIYSILTWTLIKLNSWLSVYLTFQRTLSFAQNNGWTTGATQ